jgi:cold shock CspA family protein
VKLEAFESLAPFQKKLEEYYLALGRQHAESLYYERRSKQYDHLVIRKERIVTLPAQVKCFVAMFLNEPQSTHRYYGELLSSYRNRLFSEAHSPAPYYVSGLALATLERFFCDNQLPRAWRPRKFQILMVYRLQNEPTDLPVLNSRAIDAYCEKFVKRLDDSNEVEANFRRAGKLVDSVRDKLPAWREPPERTKAFTTALVEAASKEQHTSAATTTQHTGVVRRFSDIRGWGFIRNDSDAADVFVHYSGISGDGYRSLQEGQRVQFTLIESPRGSQAVDVVPT